MLITMILEIFATVCGFIQSVLIMFKRKENWIFYMLNIVSLICFSFLVRLYGDVIENLIYVFFGLLGLFTWYSDNISKKIFKDENKIRYTNRKEKIFYFIMFFIISFVMYFLLKNTNDPQPFLDAITTGMGFTATLMMAFKRVDAWIVWLIDDCIMAYIYFILPDSAVWLMGLNIIWIFFAISTWYIWHKESKGVN